MEDQDYLSINKDAWNKRTKIHIDSAFYNQAAFMQGQTSLKEIELKMLGDIKGKSILHLQCHFGQDTLSLARMGATVCGVDLSDEAIRIATDTAKTLELKATFICCDLYNLPNHLDQQFDMVFTTYGTIGWLPDIEKWAAIVSQFLKPNGEFIFVEFHPALWMFDNDVKEVSYSYFKDEAIVEELDGTYADTHAEIKLQTISWNHGLGEVIQSLLNQHLKLLHFEEYNYSPYPIFSSGIEVGDSRYQVNHMGNKLPLTYSLKMRKQP